MIGTIYGALFLTRATASIGILFYILSILNFRKEETKQILLKVFLLITPFIFSIILMGLYNLLRFGNFFEQGYSYQILGDNLIKARDYGIFSLIHLPGNLYYLFLASPIPVLKDGISKVLSFPFISYDSWGLGLFYTSPYLLKLFTLKLKDKVSKHLLISSFVIAIPILLYYGIGVKQYGYRYSLDFLPYLFLILVLGLTGEKLSKRFKLLVVLAMVFNYYLIFTHLFVKPF